ncbi:hypothetical protein AYI68_g1182 [Smittium mucronatum]|uniref:Uncharacterized protein n=1 Tax=Smittium mucronatum TaxID=133383 RepID=A0A1R0H680_9FUNG|nr:hypothetical protein AYI68_g1182 [Smittium mucronatum]
MLPYIIPKHRNNSSYIVLVISTFENRKISTYRIYESRLRSVISECITECKIPVVVSKFPLIDGLVSKKLTEFNYSESKQISFQKKNVNSPPDSFNLLNSIAEEPFEEIQTKSHPSLDHFKISPSRGLNVNKCSDSSIPSRPCAIPSSLNPYESIENSMNPEIENDDFLYKNTSIFSHPKNLNPSFTGKPHIERYQDVNFHYTSGISNLDSNSYEKTDSLDSWAKHNNKNSNITSIIDGASFNKLSNNSFISLLKEQNVILKNQMLKNNMIIERAFVDSTPIDNKSHFRFFDVPNKGRSRNSGYNSASDLKKYHLEKNQLFSPGLNLKNSNIQKNKCKNHANNRDVLVKAIKKISSPQPTTGTNSDHLKSYPDYLNPSIVSFLKRIPEKAVANSSNIRNYSRSWGDNSGFTASSNDSSLSGLIDKISNLEATHDSKNVLDLPHLPNIDDHGPIKAVRDIPKLTPNTLKHINSIKRGQI